MGQATVAQQYVVELDARSVQLEAALAQVNQKLATTEARLDAMGASGKAASVIGEDLGVKFETGLNKINIAATGVGAALLGLGLQAAKLASDSEAALDQIGAAAPNLRDHLVGVQLDIRGIADESGRSTAEVRNAAQELARLGVSSEAELKAKLEAGTLIADATDTDLTTAVDGVTKLSRTFDEKTGDIVAGVAKIFSATNGKVSFDELFRTLDQVGPKVREAGLDYETTIRAIAALIQDGFSARKAGQWINSHDADAIREVGRQARISADAMKQLQDAADWRRNGSDREIQRSVNDLKDSLEDLGTDVLPFVVRWFGNVGVIVGALTGKMDKLVQQSGAYTQRAITLAGKYTKLGIAPNSADYNELASAVSQVQMGVLNRSIDLNALKPDELQGLKTAVAAVAELERASYAANTGAKESALNLADFSRGYSKLSAAIDTALQKQRQLNTATDTGGKKPPLPPGDAEKTAVADFRAQVASAIAAANPAAGGQLDAEIAKLQDKAKQLKGLISPGEVEKDIAALRAAVKASAEIQSNALGDELRSALATFGSSQADLVQAAADKFVDEKQKALDAIKGISDDDRAKRQAEIDDYARRSAVSVDVLRLTEQQQAADQAAARSLAEYDQQMALLNERESQLTALVSDGQAPREARNAAEKELVGIRAQLVAGAEKQSAAVIAEISRIRDEIAALEVQQLTVDPVDNAKAFDELTQQIDKYKSEIADLQLKLVQLGGVQITQLVDANKEHSKTLGFLQAHAKTVGEIAQGAVGLASAFGLVDDRTAAALQNVAAIADALPTALSGDPSSIFSVVGSITSLIGSIVGSSDTAQERELEQQQLQTLRQNTQALKDLAKRAGLLGGGASLTGSDARAALAALQGIGPYPNDPNKKLSPDQLALLQKVANALGITLDGTIGSYKILEDALEHSTTVLAEFGSDYESQLQQIDAATKILGENSPAQQLEMLAAAAGKVSPAVAKLFQGLNLADPKDLATLEQRVQALFKTMEAGGDQLSQTDLGGLTGDELVQLLENITDQVNAATGTTTDSTSGTGGYSVSHTITEETGGQLTALLTTANIYASRTAIATETISQYLASLANLPAIPVPDIGALTSRGSSAAGGVVIQMVPGAIVIQVSSDDVAAAARAGKAAAQEFLKTAQLDGRKISQALKKDLNQQKLARGNLLLG